MLSSPPEGGAAFAVTNYESAAIVKARELHRNAIKGRSTEGELDTWSPEVISFNTPEQLVLNFERSGDQEDAWGRLTAAGSGASPAIQKSTQRLRLLANFRTFDFPNRQNRWKLLIQLWQ